MSHRNLLLLLGALVVSYACYVRAEQNPYARYVAGAFSTIDRWALDNVPDDELFDAAMHGMVDVLHKYGDEHSEFIDSNRQDAFNEDYQQEFGGVGLRLWLLGEPPLPTVIGLPEPGTPAAAANIRIADRLMAVDDKPTAGLTLEEVTAMVRGLKGTPVKLTLARVGEEKPRDVTVERAVITVESVLGDLRGPDGRWNFLISEEPRIGYARITKFGDKTASELAGVLAQLADGKHMLEGLIIDVRDDPGGTLDGAVDICDLFLKAGQTIVTTRGRDKTVLEPHMSTGSGDPDLPLAVLVDRNSASASEILAACLQDHKRAVVVGERSYGKGTVQRLMRIESGRSMLKLTVATYWRPSGKNIHRMKGDPPDGEWGVTPEPELTIEMDDKENAAWRHYRARRDLVGEDLDSELATALDAIAIDIPPDFVDRPLQAAIEYLRAQAAEAAKPAKARKKDSAR
jgi:carboxyl-terminal processing protease